MNTSKCMYGTKKLGLEDLIETRINHEVELKYYKIKVKNQYAVEIEKTEQTDNGLITESERMNLLTDNEEITNEILDVLMRNKVTPIGLNDTMIEITKTLKK